MEKNGKELIRGQGSECNSVLFLKALNFLSRSEDPEMVKKNMQQKQFNPCRTPFMKTNTVLHLLVRPP